MKIRNFFVGAVTALAFIVGCQEKEQNLGTPAISISKSEMTFEVAGGDQELTVTSSRDWKVENDADWVVVSPSSGEASANPQTVTVSVLENTGLDRTADLVFTIGLKKQYLTVNQAGPEGSAEALVVYANDFDISKAQNNSGWPYLDKNYDLWDNKKGTGSETVEYEFGGKMSVRTSGKASNDGSGFSHYAGSGTNKIFFGAATSILKINKITLNGTQTDFALSFGGQKYLQDGDSNFSWSEFKAYVSNDAQKWVELSMAFPADADVEGDWNLASCNFTVPAGTAQLCVAFVSTCSSAYSIDDVILQNGVAGQVIDFSTGVAIDGTSTGGDNTGSTTAPESKGKKTVAEFIAAADKSNYYELTGTVSGFSSQYCSFDLTDATGKIYVYSVLDASKSEWSSKIANGGTITIYGKYDYYANKSQHEVVDAYIISYTSGGGETPTPPAGDGSVVTIAEFLANGGSAIEGVVISNMDLNNLTSKKGMYIQDDTAGLQFYLAENHTFAYGDKVRVDVSGVSVGAYNGAVQVSGLALDKITKISSGNTVTPKTVTIADFLANKYEGQYIAIEGVQVADADLSKTFVMGGAHTSISMEDANGNKFVVFSSKYATYGTTAVPQGSGTIKGISSINNGNMQIIFAQQSDFAGLTGTRFDGTEVTPPAGGGDEGGEDPVTPPAGGEGQYEPNITWTLGTNAYDNTSTGTNYQTATVNGVSVKNLLKLGTGSKVGDATLHVPAGTAKLGFYCVAWKGKTAQVKFSVGGTDIKTINPAANAGATGNAPYTALNVADSDYYEVELPAGTTDIKVETLDPSNGRALFVGLKAF